MRGSLGNRGSEAQALVDQKKKRVEHLNSLPGEWFLNMDNKKAKENAEADLAKAEKVHAAL